MHKTNRELPYLEHALPKCLPEGLFEICNLLVKREVVHGARYRPSRDSGWANRSRRRRESCIQYARVPEYGWRSRGIQLFMNINFI